MRKERTMKMHTSVMVMILCAAGLAHGADSAAEKKPANDWTRVDKPYQCLDFSWVPRTLAKVPDLKSDKPRYNLWVLGTGEEMQKSVMAMIWDESQGPGKGYDVLYVDRNFNGDLTEPDERMELPKSQYPSFPPFVVKDAGGKRTYSFKITGWEHDGTIGGYPSMIEVPGLYNVGPLPGNLRYQWGGDLKTAPIYHLGGPLGYYNGSNPGSLLGTFKAGDTMTVCSFWAVLGDKPAVQWRASQRPLPTYLRVLDKAGKPVEDVLIGGHCTCGGTYTMQLQVPGRVPPGKHEVVSRDESSRVEYVYTVQIENPEYGKPLDDPGYAALKARFPQAKFASLRRAANVPAELTKAYPDENVVPVNVRHVVLRSNHREGDERGRPVSDAGPYLAVGSVILYAEPLSALMQWDLSAIPKEAKILGAQLRLALIKTQFVGTDKTAKLIAWPMRRAWLDKPGTNGFTCWYGPQIGAKDGSKDIQWGKPGCNDPESDYFPAPETSVDVAGFPGSQEELRRVVSLDLTELLQKWHAGELANHGIVVKLRGGSLDIVSGNHAESVLRPALVIAYEGPDPQPQYVAPAAMACPVK